MLLILLIVTGPLIGVTTAETPSSTDGDAPFAEAGLDQDATVGDRVRLDGGGSRAPAGQIDEYDWSITGPNGTSFEPSCRTCTRTEFVPDRPGRYAVTLTVTDDRGRTDSDTLYVDGSGPQPDDGPGYDAPNSSLSVSGPRVLTGEAPFEATYGFVGTEADDVESVTWYDESGEIGTGTELDTEWDAGTHELYATVEGVDSDRVTFEDGTRVVADPRPNVSMTASRGDGEFTGSLTVTDEFGNLDSVTLYVGEEMAQEWTPDDGATFETPFTVDRAINPNSSRIRAVATDDRDQSATESNQPGTPELVRSGFVNGPVDSYHERIDPDRYTAVHEIVIDLNGVDPSEVSPNIDLTDSRSVLTSLGSPKRQYNRETDNLLIRSKWASETLGEHTISLRGEHIPHFGSTLEITSSPPEVRLDILDEGEDSHYDGYKLLVDVSESFDPDGSDLTFHTKNQEVREGDSDQIGLVFSKSPELRVSDQQGNTVVLSSQLYDYWSPDITSIEEVSNGPYEANDTVRFSVETGTYQISDVGYEPNFDVRFKNTEGKVLDWNKGSHKENTGHDHNPKEHGHPKFSGTVQIKAASFQSLGTPKVGVANTEKRSQSTTWKSFPRVDVYEQSNLERNNVVVSDIEYTEQPTKYERSVSSRADLLRYESRGYHVEQKSETLKAITIERRQITGSVVEDKRTFPSRAERRQFTSTHNDWSRAGTTEHTTLKVKTEWFDTRSGKGSFTGRTRAKTVCVGDDARQYGGRCVPADSYDKNTQYLHRYYEKVDEKMYAAEKRVPDIQWNKYATVHSERTASRYARRGGYRVGNRYYSTRWELVKYVDRRTTSSSYDEASNVIKTTAIVEGEFHDQKSSRSTSKSYGTVTKDFKRSIAFDGLKSREEIVTAVEEGADLMKTACSSDSALRCS